MSSYHAMTAYIVRCFPEAPDFAESAHRPAPPGEVRPVETKPICFIRAQPMDFLHAAYKALLSGTEGSKPSLARYPSNRFWKLYAVNGHESPGKAAKLNTDLAIALNTKGREPQVVVHHADMTCLKGVLVCQCEAQNFLFWSLGAFYKFFSPLHPGPEDKLMADQLFHSIHLAMVDTAKDSTFVLTNVKAMRQEAVLALLPAAFKSATIMDLRKSAIDSASLFDEDRVREALKSAEAAPSFLSTSGSKGACQASPISRHTPKGTQCSAAFRHFLTASLSTLPHGFFPLKGTTTPVFWPSTAGPSSFVGTVFF